VKDVYNGDVFFSILFPNVCHVRTVSAPFLASQRVTFLLPPHSPLFFFFPKNVLEDRKKSPLFFFPPSFYVE